MKFKANLLICFPLFSGINNGLVTFRCFSFSSTIHFYKNVKNRSNVAFSLRCTSLSSFVYAVIVVCLCLSVCFRSAFLTPLHVSFHRCKFKSDATRFTFLGFDGHWEQVSSIVHPAGLVSLVMTATVSQSFRRPHRKAAPVYFAFSVFESIHKIYNQLLQRTGKTGLSGLYRQIEISCYFLLFRSHGFRHLPKRRKSKGRAGFPIRLPYLAHFPPLSKEHVTSLETGKIP